MAAEVLAFKIDENLPAEIADLLRSAGFDASTVLLQKLGGKEDLKIASVCKAEQRVIVTLDLDFSDIRGFPPADYHGIIVLRPQRQDKFHLLEIFSRLIPIFASSSPFRQLWIVDERSIRIREGTP